MNVQEYQVKIKLTPALEPLLEMAYNLWWCWNNTAKNIFREINEDVWVESDHNPISVLASLSFNDCERLEKDQLFMDRMKRAHTVFKDYLKAPRWFNSKENPDFQIAYFSLEYGIHEALPLYSGGLGILSGDHCKAASDVGLPFVAVGLLYRNGYFHQYTNSDGWQQEEYSYNEFYNLPMKPVKDAEGKDVYITVPMFGGEMRIRLWKLVVGSIDLILLDTDLPDNKYYEREITGRLYSGDTDMRIKQEIVLGVGGVRALYACGYKPTVFHLNEGHPAFASFERLNMMLRSGMPQNVAIRTIRKSTLFTTHTPVPAGFDIFNADQIRNYLEPVFYGTSMNLNQLMALGRANPFNEGEPFNMAVACIKLSAFRNGVSALHGEVSRKMFHYMWPNALEKKVPIGYVTNGVHLPSFISGDFKWVFYQQMGDKWKTMPYDTEVWKKVQEIPSRIIYETKRTLREKLILYARKKMKETLRKKGVSAAELMECDDILNPDILTIGFARRFATYKRATLLFSDEERLLKILSDPARPVQIIFAGKAHPRDNEGKEFIKRIIHISRKPEFRKYLIFIEDYDIAVAKYLTAGVDVWLNNPRRPLEASGTSGMKAAANGALNFSVLDGWWAEGFNGQNGFAIGGGEDYTDNAYQDYVESHDLYNKLENEIVPLFYTKDRSGLPEGWIQMVKNTLATCPAYFNTFRMLIDYTTKYYLPLHKLHEDFSKGDNAAQFLKWWDKIIFNWDGLSIYNCKLDAADFSMGETVKGRANVNRNSLDENDISVYVVLEYNGESGKLDDPVFIPMTAEEQADDGSTVYKSSFLLTRAGKAKVGFAVVPTNRFVTSIFELNKIKWG